MFNGEYSNIVRLLFLPNGVFLEFDRLTLKFIEKSKGPGTSEDKG